MIKLEDPTLFRTENFVNGKWVAVPLAILKY